MVRTTAKRNTTPRKPKTSPFVDKVLGLLLALGPVHAKAMFGGYGLCLDGTMFAIITRDERLFFKVDDESRAAFAKAGGEPFSYERRRESGTRVIVMSYCEAPDGTVTSTKRLLPWAERGVAAATRAARRKAAKKRRA